MADSGDGSPRDPPCEATTGWPYEVLQGIGGHLRFDLHSTAQSTDFQVIVFGFNNPRL